MKKRHVESDLAKVTKIIERIDAKIERCERKKTTIEKRKNILKKFINASFLASVITLAGACITAIAIQSKAKDDIKTVNAIYDEIFESDEYSAHYALMREEIGARFGSGEISLNDAKKELKKLDTREYVLSVAPEVTPNLYAEFEKVQAKIDAIENEYDGVGKGFYFSCIGTLATTAFLNSSILIMKNENAWDDKIYRLNKKKILLTSSEDDGEDFDFSKIM